MKLLIIFPAFACLLLLSNCSGISIGTGGDNNTSSNDDSSHATQDQVNQQQANDNTQNMVNQINAASDQAAMTPIPPQ